MSSSYDIIIVGAGLSGINSAYQLRRQLPDHSFAILEARDRVGGTWDFFNYPGIRCDSPMPVYALPWRPWADDRLIVDAHEIRDYIDDAATSSGIAEKIRFGHRLTAASWSSTRQRWSLDVDVSTNANANANTNADTDNNRPAEGHGVERKVFDAKFVVWCSGYYDYKNPLPAVIPGIERFQGQVVHPQFWSDEADFAGKRVVIIGSGATTITVFPAIAKTAASATMLQRSPSYVAPVPARDNWLGSLIRLVLPSPWAAWVNRWRAIFGEYIPFAVLSTFPSLARSVLMNAAKSRLPPHIDVAKHFTPSYNAFEQRVCFCPDGDFFDALHQPNCEIVTDTIDTVTETGIKTTSGRVLDADMIVTATGLTMTACGNVPITIDGGAPVNDTLGGRYFWNGVMVEGLPNSGLIIGYVAQTWTPGADARIRLLINVLSHMDRVGASSATPTIDPEVRKTLPRKPALHNNSTYVVSARSRIPMVADVGPWKYGQSFPADMWTALFGSSTDGMKYVLPAEQKKVD